MSPIIGSKSSLQEKSADGVALEIEKKQPRPTQTLHPHTPWAVRQFQSITFEMERCTREELRFMVDEYTRNGGADPTKVDLWIPSDVRQELGRELARIRISPYEKDTQFQFVAKAKHIMESVLPKVCLDAIKGLREPGHRGILNVHGMPLDPDAGPTPIDGVQPKAGEKLTFVGEGVHLGVAALLGQVYTLEFEKAHRVIQTVAPVRGMETFPGSVGSAEAFGMHQEDRVHPYSPEVLVLSCLRADAEGIAETCAGSFWDVAPELAKEENWDVLLALQEPIFSLKLPIVFQQQGLDNEVVGPVLHFEEGTRRPILAVNMNGMRALNARGQHALDMLCAWFEATWMRTRMAPGDMALLFNRSAVHTRTSAFAVRGDGTDRWLLRTFVHPNPPAGIVLKDRPEWNSMHAVRAW